MDRELINALDEWAVGAKYRYNTLAEWLAHRGGERWLEWEKQCEGAGIDLMARE